jgi:AraC family transcriptional regulator, regulatory protein of adaptative response / methylated-DNA-[protein]-cysteine methyltransferase
LNFRDLLRRQTLRRTSSHARYARAPFQRSVWEKLCAIPLGRTVTYMELARWISPLASPRAVAGACAANPIALAVPCHRVVRSNGDLAGYHWGVERKRELLRRETLA